MSERVGGSAGVMIGSSAFEAWGPAARLGFDPMQNFTEELQARCLKMRRGEYAATLS